MLHSDTGINDMQSGAENNEQVSASVSDSQISLSQLIYKSARTDALWRVQSLLNAMALIASAMIFSSLWGLLGLRLGVSLRLLWLRFAIEATYASLLHVATPFILSFYFSLSLSLSSSPTTHYTHTHTHT